MDKKQNDRTYDGLQLTDEQLDHVIGGVTLPPQQILDMFSDSLQLNSVKAVGKPLFRK